MNVFISHSSRDKPAVEALARYLRSVGIDAWFDKWEIAPGDGIIAKINQALARREQRRLVELFGQLAWDDSFNHKAERSRQ